MGLNSSSIEDHAESEEECFHVLAVDDNLIDRKLLERLLKSSSYHGLLRAVTCVESGDKALKYLGVYDECSSEKSSHCCGAANYTSSSSSSPLQQEGLKVNLIMTDFSMPGMNGYDLLIRLKKSRWKDVPVVVMSSDNVPSRINMCLEGGAEEFLLKPLQLSDLDKIQPYLLKSSC